MHDDERESSLEHIRERGLAAWLRFGGWQLGAIAAVIALSAVVLVIALSSAPSPPPGPFTPVDLRNMTLNVDAAPYSIADAAADPVILTGTACNGDGDDLKLRITTFFSTVGSGEEVRGPVIAGLDLGDHGCGPITLAGTVDRLHPGSWRFSITLLVYETGSCDVPTPASAVTSTTVLDPTPTPTDTATPTPICDPGRRSQLVPFDSDPFEVIE